jgi:hypothetical protein
MERSCLKEVRSGFACLGTVLLSSLAFPAVLSIDCHPANADTHAVVLCECAQTGRRVGSHALSAHFAGEQSKPRADPVGEHA